MEVLCGEGALYSRCKESCLIGWKSQALLVTPSEFPAPTGAEMTASIAELLTNKAYYTHRKIKHALNSNRYSVVYKRFSAEQ